jgi:hypothetical protein
MKDWKRSPEPASMMGAHRAASYTSEGSPSPHTATMTPNLAACNTNTEENHHQYVRQKTKAETSLADMTKKIILQKLHLFDTFGNTPFPIVRPILEQCTAKKLSSLEAESPVSTALQDTNTLCSILKSLLLAFSLLQHLAQHTNYIWKRLCLKEFKDLSNAYNHGILGDVDSWKELFEVCLHLSLYQDREFF